MDQKQEYPSELVVKILKRILSLYGPRKYLLEGFPRNQADCTALEQMCSQYSRIELMGYINIELTEQQMKEAGVKMLKERKKEESDDSIETEVRQAIEEYRNKIKPVLEYYQSKTCFINEPWTNNDVYQVNLKIEAHLGKQKIQPVRNVPIHFLLGN